jgi:prepilin-type N-terminal cleavage/methylation domain-containing protein
MLKYLAKTEKGFTLMELLIAVGIVAVLAGVGVPLYLKLQTGAKATEANVHIDSIRTCLESYKLVKNSYTNCAAAPRAAAAVDEEPADWVPGGDFDAIGFAPNASVRFAYAVGGPDAVDGATSTQYTVGAVGDTNGDGNQILYISTESIGPHVVEALDPRVDDLNHADAFGAGAVNDGMITD